jgi:NAD-dependent deacetylase
MSAAASRTEEEGVLHRHVPSSSSSWVPESQQSPRVVVLTVAGVCAESGISTFRDKQTGLWEKFDASELSTPYAFARDPELVWGWYESRRAMVLSAKPNAGRLAIAAMADHIPHITLITQNVDDLHKRSGSRDVLHLHGDLSHPYCENSRQPYNQPLEMPPLPSDGARLEPPQCASCGAKICPGSSGSARVSQNNNGQALATPLSTATSF